MGGRALAAAVVVALALAAGTPAYGATARAGAGDGAAVHGAADVGGSRAFTRLADQLPAGTRVLADRNGKRQRNDTITDLAVGMRRYHDRAAWLRTAADLTALATGEEVAAASDHGEESPSGKLVEVLRAGDLDGDGRDDVLALTFDLQTDEVVVQARRGSDAGVLWERTAGADGALMWPLREDVDGDGIDDLSVEGLEIHSEDVVEECEEYEGEQWCWPVEYHATFTWTIGVASGADGELLWSRDESGQVDEVYALEEQETVVLYDYDERYELESTNLYAFTMLAGDLAGVERQDAIVETLDINVVEAYDGTWTGVVGTDNGELRVRALTEADIAEAATGEVRHSFRDDAAGRISFLTPAPHAVGGPGPDLLWDTTVAPDQAYECLYADLVVDGYQHCADEYDGGWAVDLSIVDGATLEPAWTVSVPAGWFGFPVGGDLDDDGGGDLLMMAEDEDGLTTIALSGATGATLWEHRSLDDWLFPTAVAPIDEVAGDDLVTMTMVWGWEVDDETALVTERRNGQTGEVISSQRHALPQRNEDANFVFTFVYAGGTGDGDGDAVSDLTFGWVQESYQVDEVTWEFRHLSTDVRAVAESGRTGDLRRDVHRNDGTFVSFWGTGDLDGDGLVELVENDATYDEETNTESGRWTVLPFLPGDPMWSAVAQGTWVWLGEAGELDAEPGEELLVTSYDEGVQWSSTVQALSGRSGTELWRLSTR